MWGIILLVPVLAHASAAQEGSVPASVIEWASTDPLTLVELLAEAGVPAGLEVPDSERQALLKKRRQWNPAVMNRERLRGEPSRPLADLVNAFNKAQSRFVSAAVDGVFVVRPAGVRSPYLDDRPLTGRIEGEGLMRVAEKVFAPLDASLDKPGGRLSSTPGIPGVDVDRGEGVHIAIENVEKLTVLQVLNEMTRRSGHAWMVTISGHEDPRISAFGFIHRYGTSSLLPLHQQP